MPLQSQILIEPTLSAVTTTKFVAITQDMTPATLFVTNLSGAEEVDVVITPDNGTTTQVIIQEGVTVVLTASDNTKSINSPMHIGVTKDATVIVSGVFLSYHIKV